VSASTRGLPFIAGDYPGPCPISPSRARLSARSIHLSNTEDTDMDLIAESQGKLSGLELLRKMIADGRGPPIADTLKFHLAELDKGRAVFRATPGPHAYNPIGVVHGGYAATLLDSALGCAVHSCLDATQAYTTLELKVAYHKALTLDTGPVEAEGKIVSVGRRVAFAEARLVDASGRLYASATSTLLVFERPAA
jgi:uncharacterized protein (TIGR00369 family)